MTIRTSTKRVNKSRLVLNRYENQVKQIIAAGGNMVRNEAVESINNHRSSGETYQKYNPRRTHTASTAGNPPNTDTGYLVSNIHLVLDSNKLGCSVESRADYSESLEFGTSRMAARPFMQPALESQRPKIRSLFARLRARG
jgi:HK97 gp10 family phage protein